MAVTRSAGTTQSGSPQPPSDRGITCIGSTRCVAPQTMQGLAGDRSPLAVGRRQSTRFAAAAWFVAAACGRAGVRAGEAVCASSVLLS